MVDLNAFQIFADHLSNLKETSIDKRDGTPQYMTLSTREAVNFDGVKEEYVKPLGVSEIPKSNDALFDDGKGFLVFVEFKNGFMDRPKQFAVRKKVYDSALIFTDIKKFRNGFNSASGSDPTTFTRFGSMENFPFPIEFAGGRALLKRQEPLAQKTG